MSRKNEVANAMADRYSEWFRSKIREAYLKGWEDSERSMLERAEALVMVLHKTPEECIAEELAKEER